MRSFALALTFLVVVGCSQTNFIATLAITCDSYATALNVLAKKRAAERLTPKQIRTVNDVRVLVGPVCLPGSDVVDPRSALLKITESVHTLVLMKGE